MSIFPVSKNARFTHDMANFGFVVRGKRFSAHEAVWITIRKMPLTNVRGIFAVRMGHLRIRPYLIENQSLNYFK